MIRDFHGITKRRLKEEIDALEEVVDGDVWAAIDGVRQVGNIGAHTENDVNLVVEVDPEEAQTMISLLEQLVELWYVKRHDQQQGVSAMKALATKKSEERSALKGSDE